MSEPVDEHALRLAAVGDFRPVSRDIAARMARELLSARERIAELEAEALRYREAVTEHLHAEMGALVGKLSTLTRAREVVEAARGVRRCSDPTITTAGDVHRCDLCETCVLRAALTKYDKGSG